MNFCSKKKFPHPITFNLNNYSAIKNKIIFPAIIKPNITYGARGFVIVNSLKKIEEELPRVMMEYGDCHIQEFIPAGGRQFLVGIYTKNGELINSTVVQKMRYYPIKGGSSCFNQSIDDINLVNLCYSVQKELGWEGYAHYDIIEDPRNGEMKIMELNPRVQGCLKSSVTAGVDFVANIINDSFGIPLVKYNYKPGAYLRYFGLDILWFLYSRERFTTKPSWFKGFFKRSHYFQDGSIDDLKPLFFGTFSGIFRQFSDKVRDSKKGMN